MAFYLVVKIVKNDLRLEMRYLHLDAYNDFDEGSIEPGK